MNQPLSSHQRRPVATARLTRAEPGSTGLLPVLALLGAMLGMVPATAMLGGCAYKITIQQGNYLDEELIDQVEIAMTRDQVQFLLGTPMVNDPFHAERWDYLYYVISGKRRRRVDQGHFVVYFENDRVASVERIVGPET